MSNSKCSKSSSASSKGLLELIQEEKSRRQVLWTSLPDRDGQPSPQRLAYESPADVLGFGGAGGGGKSDLILGLAVTQHRRALIFRREAKQLQAMIDRAREILGARGSLNVASGRW